VTLQPDRSAALFAFLNEHNIEYVRQDHPPVFTVAEARRHVPPMPGANTKNLFLRDRKGLRHFLVVVGYEKTVDLKALTGILDVRKLGFSSPDRLRRYLGVDPGSVSVMGLVNDQGVDVELIVDSELWSADAFLCHPLTNTSTIVIAKDDLIRFLELTGHQPYVVEIPARDTSPS
jgi:Ala-tRNA(Pro) deacylase